ncbi:hypothetical protein L4174_016655 [Photobacterium sp. CCB-ST2H9]|uniref:hypothetical protein n=1 Tax=Photobacterium sp. CCB-ST2H9 TaxID=2912855 RepID=UPI002006BB6A|nr:hypothetical protein [Photobacterium sp. CCB-ST2H9]UTM59706.1 hypothetical protein L4174_016655 [Photobacterium sp. CCB-ST2H9]
MENVPSKTLAHGETEHQDDILRVGLSPLPVTTGRKPISINQFVANNKEGTLDVRLVNTDVYMIQLFFLMTICYLGVIVWLWSAVSTDMLDITAPLYLLITIGTFLPAIEIVRNQVGKINENLPFRFHAQRKEVLFSLIKKNKTVPERPDLNGSGFFDLYPLSSLFLITFGLTLILVDIKRELFSSVFYTGASSLLIGIIPAYIAIKPWLQYFKAKRGLKISVELFAVPWEEVYVEYQRGDGVNPWGMISLQNLTFSAPIPDHPEQERVLFSIPIYSKEEALSLYELFREYMEKGASGIEHTAAGHISVHRGEYSREGYRQLIRKRMRETPFIFPFWWILNVITLRYFAHWYLEYLIDTLQEKAMAREDFIAWSQPIPEAEWRPMSPELQAANAQVEALYAQGLRWDSDEVQEVIQQYHR